MGEFLSNKRESALRVLSKSKLLAFRQCPKRLWLEVHRPDLREDSSATQASFTVGHQVGDIASNTPAPTTHANIKTITASLFQLLRLFNTYHLSSKYFKRFPALFFLVLAQSFNCLD